MSDLSEELKQEMYDYVKTVETIRLEAKQLQESISYLKSQNDGKVWSGD